MGLRPVDILNDLYTDRMLQYSEAVISPYLYNAELLMLYNRSEYIPYQPPMYQYLYYANNPLSHYLIVNEYFTRREIEYCLPTISGLQTIKEIVKLYRVNLQPCMRQAVLDHRADTVQYLLSIGVQPEETDAAIASVLNYQDIVALIPFAFGIPVSCAVRYNNMNLVVGQTILPDMLEQAIQASVDMTNYVLSRIAYLPHIDIAKAPLPMFKIVEPYYEFKDNWIVQAANAGNADTVRYLLSKYKFSQSVLSHALLIPHSYAVTKYLLEHTYNAKVMVSALDFLPIMSLI